MAIEDLLNAIPTGTEVAPNLRRQLRDAINEMITNHFSELVQVLYRVDVSERKLKEVLAMNKGADAADLITDLLLERWKEKLYTRQQFRFNTDDIPPEERW